MTIHINLSCFMVHLKKNIFLSFFFFFLQQIYKIFVFLFNLFNFLKFKNLFPLNSNNIKVTGYLDGC